MNEIQPRRILTKIYDSVGAAGHVGCMPTKLVVETCGGITNASLSQVHTEAQTISCINLNLEQMKALLGILLLEVGHE